LPQARITRGLYNIHQLFCKFQYFIFNPTFSDNSKREKEKRKREKRKEKSWTKKAQKAQNPQKKGEKRGTP